MGVDYEQQLLDNEAEKKTAIDNSNASFDKTINDYQTVVDKQQQQLKDYEAQQTRLQQEQTDFAIDKINQQREQAEKDYTKEQQAAYGDYKRQTDPYGANAEQMAALGLSQSGYSESSNVAMYTAYQNRVATARASFEQAKQTFANAIQEAKLTNDVNLAKIAQETLEKSLTLSMESIVYLGNLQQEKAANARAIEQTYYGRAQDIRAAQEAEIANAQYETLLAGLDDDPVITGNEGTDNGTLEEMLKTAYPNGVVDDVDYWNQMVEAAGGEEKLKEMGYSLAGQTAEGNQVGLPKYTDEYTLMVDEYERLKDAYIIAENKYAVAAKWGPAHEEKAALEAAKEAYENYPVKINPDYEPQKKKFKQARASYNVATSENEKIPTPEGKEKVAEAKKKMDEEYEKLQNMKPYIITQKGNSSNGTSLSMTQDNKTQASLR